MTASRIDTCSEEIVEDLPRSLPDIKLHHGEAVWVLGRLGFQGAATKSTFYEYIKSLRKFGTPFDRSEYGFARRGLANYSYGHLMELALVLTLRVYHVVPDSVLAEVIRRRTNLYRYYRRAIPSDRRVLAPPLSLKRPVGVRSASGVYFSIFRSIFLAADCGVLVPLNCSRPSRRSLSSRSGTSLLELYSRSTCPICPNGWCPSRSMLRQSDGDLRAQPFQIGISRKNEEGMITHEAM